MSWETVQIKDICKKVTSGGTPLTSKENYYFPRQIPWIKTREINYCRITDTETYISQEGLNNSSAKLIPANSVIVAMYGQGDTAGRVAINKIPVATNQACCNLIIDEAKADYRFVYYKLSTLYEKLVSLKNGGAQPNLNAAIIKSLEIKIPSLEMQHNISDMLSAYDDLIENNQKQIKLLEEAAQRLYKEWFVDLRFPGYENTPITDGVPQGWKKELVGNVIEKSYRSKQVMTADYLAEGKIPIIDQSRDFIAGYTDDEETLVFLGKPVIVFGDHTRVLKYIQFPFAKGADGTQLIVSKCENMPQSLLYLSLSNVDLSNYHYARHFKYLKAEEIIVPDIVIAKHFEKLVQPIFERVQVLRYQINNAKQARDRLLPKLMSGELEV